MNTPVVKKINNPWERQESEKRLNQLKLQKSVKKIGDSWKKENAEKRKTKVIPMVVTKKTQKFTSSKDAIVKPIAKHKSSHTKVTKGKIIVKKEDVAGVHVERKVFVPAAPKKKSALRELLKKRKTKPWKAAPMKHTMSFGR